MEKNYRTFVNVSYKVRQGFRKFSQVSLKFRQLHAERRQHSRYMGTNGCGVSGTAAWLERGQHPLVK